MRLNVPGFSQRSQELELMDDPEISAEEIWAVLAELDTINRLLGGYQITIDALSQFLVPGRQWHILDVGCGGGDNLRMIAQWAQKKGLDLKLTGLDLNPDCLAYAQKKAAESRLSDNIDWLACDYRDWKQPDHQPVDVVISTLFCHHLDDLQLKDFLAWTKNNARFGFIINDLHRHPLAWYSIRFLTQILSRSRLVRFDAPLSVARGFTRVELETALMEEGLRPQIHWRWAFRYLVMGYV